MQKLSAENIRMFGLTQPQFGVIESLGHLGPLTLGELSRKELSSCGNTTVVVDNLERDGLVLRKPCPRDRRVVYVELTPRGQKLFRNTFLKHASFIAELASVLTEEEQVELSRLLKKLGVGLVGK
jgi:MarR family 2-MHQ and catechol resistance regulon transcriptional repressor